MVGPTTWRRAPWCSITSLVRTHGGQPVPGQTLLCPPAVLPVSKVKFNHPSCLLSRCLLADAGWSAVPGLLSAPRCRPAVPTYQLHTRCTPLPLGRLHLGPPWHSVLQRQGPRGLPLQILALPTAGTRGFKPTCISPQRYTIYLTIIACHENNLKFWFKKKSYTSLEMIWISCWLKHSCATSMKGKEGNRDVKTGVNYWLSLWLVEK